MALTKKEQETLSLFLEAIASYRDFDLPSDLAGNKEFMLAAINQYGRALKYAADELKGDRDFILDAVKRDYAALENASTELRSDREIILAAVAFLRTKCYNGIV